MPHRNRANIYVEYEGCASIQELQVEAPVIRMNFVPRPTIGIFHSEVGEY